MYFEVKMILYTFAHVRKDRNHIVLIDKNLEL